MPLFLIFITPIRTSGPKTALQSRPQLLFVRSLGWDFQSTTLWVMGALP